MFHTCREGQRPFRKSALSSCLSGPDPVRVLRALLAADPHSMRELTQRCAEAQKQVSSSAGLSQVAVL